ncbi:MAG: diaminopimelate epimerase [Mucilaginibacter polytrichastri]|nr:diaminopimelate epimerase [Mucilaginibacter polytrichastri]
MKLTFWKYQGTGNDFIMVDNREKRFRHNRVRVLERLCDRRFGIGGDGIIFLENEEGYDFRMDYYNADGKPGSMCGNGGRCVVAFAHHLGIFQGETRFLAVDGEHAATINADGNFVSLKMADVSRLDQDGNAWILNTGSPHYVLETAEVVQKDVAVEGRMIRNSPRYLQEGINVNFVQQEGRGYFVRTYERGVEDETYACGTGVTAVALAMAAKSGKRGEQKTPIRVLGGKLSVRFFAGKKGYTDIYLEGPAERVYSGEIDWPA